MAEETVTIIEVGVSYLFQEKNDQIIGQGEANARLAQDSLAILPKSGETQFFSLRDILQFQTKDYRIELKLLSGEKLQLFYIGYRYEDFLNYFVKARNEVILKDLLMYEKLTRPGVNAEFNYLDSKGIEIEKDQAEIRLYETAFVILPIHSELLRIPYSSLEEIQDVDYKLILRMDSGNQMVLSMLGKEHDSFTKAIGNVLSAQNLKIQTTLKNIFPEAEPSVIRQAARCMKEGKTVGRKTIEAISPQLWLRLEQKLEQSGLKMEYQFLKSIGQADQVHIGIKRGLLGDLTGEYIWFLMPVIKPEMGNALVMEAVTIAGSEVADEPSPASNGLEYSESDGEEASDSETSNRATYFFSLVKRHDYPGAFTHPAEIESKVDELCQRLHHCLMAINFRREPIYLPESSLMLPKYYHYRFAVQKIPDLQILRKLFIGRIAHLTPEQWQSDVAELLRFNASTDDETLKWSKNQR